MDNNRLLGYILIAVGVLALIASLGAGTGWLWVAVIAAGFLFAYARQRTYGFLVVGGILAGVAVGIFLIESWNWGSGAFLLSLAAGFVVIDRLEPRPNRWPLYVAAILAALGLLVWLMESNLLTSWWFALALIVVGAALLLRGRSESGWVSVPPAQPVSSPPPAATAPQTPEHLGQQSGPAHHAPATDQGVVPITPAEEPPSPAEPLSPEAQARLDRLLAWRKATAARDGVSAFVVMPNATLEQLARMNPQTLEELAAIKGIGPVKLERYGNELLAVLAGKDTNP